MTKFSFSETTNKRMNILINLSSLELYINGKMYIYYEKIILFSRCTLNLFQIFPLFHVYRKFLCSTLIYHILSINMIAFAYA